MSASPLASPVLPVASAVTPYQHRSRAPLAFFPGATAPCVLSVRPGQSARLSGQATRKSAPWEGRPPSRSFRVQTGACLLCDGYDPTEIPLISVYRSRLVRHTVVAPNGIMKDVEHRSFAHSWKDLPKSNYLCTTREGTFLLLCVTRLQFRGRGRE